MIDILSSATVHGINTTENNSSSYELFENELKQNIKYLLLKIKLQY